MSKILLVEDDNNLREIYEARLQAEGYTIVAAHDGEEALVVAKAEKPDLIISDVMMPKISGFEMLDILRNTDTLKDVKIIMLTALGQSDDQQRADKLGADRYLVKSQVTLEDIVNVTNEMLKGDGQTVDAVMPSLTEKQAATAPTQTTSTSLSEPVAPPPPTQPAPAPADPAPPIDSSPKDALSPPQQDDPASDTGIAETASQESDQVKSQIDSIIGNQPSTQNPSTTAPPVAAPPAAVPPTTDAASPLAANTNEPFLTPEDDNQEKNQPDNYTPMSSGMKVVEPLPESESKPDLSTLLQQEEAKEAAEGAIAPPSTGTNVVTPPPVGGNVDPNNVGL